MNQKSYINPHLLFIMLLAMMSNTGCKKFLVVEAPSTNVNEENVYQSDETAIAVLTQMYSVISGDGVLAGRTGVSLLLGLSADELTLANSVSDQKLNTYYRNQLQSVPGAEYGSDNWTTGLTQLFTCNAAIEGVTRSTSLTDVVKTQLLGEAKFMRAFLYFYLVNLYGDVPLVLTTNPNVNRSLPRSPKQDVYAQIATDLKDAQVLLSNSFLDASLLKSTSERVRPTKWAATALLARTYLYTGQFADAENEASEIIDNATQFSLCDSLNRVFLRNSSEAIWQLQPVQSSQNTDDAMTFILTSTGPNSNVNPVYISPQVLNAFEAGDERRKGGNWVDSVNAGGITYFYPAKYKAKATTGGYTEYLMVFRLGEQYLIRAEARAHQNDIKGAKDDLNEIRRRAGLSVTNANDQSSLLNAIYKERQVELFTELGQRWLDLKRTGKVDAVMTMVTPQKANGAGWQSYQQLYPIRYTDIERNSNLVQNPGY